MVADNRKITGAGTTVQIQNARYPKVGGLGNPALARRINAELRGPLDRFIAMAKDVECHGRPMNIGLETALGIRGPRLVSVRYYKTTDSCQQADGSPGGEVVTIDLRTGRRLTARDVFRAGTLTPAGVRRLKSRVEKRVDVGGGRFESCFDDIGFEVADFFPRKTPAADRGTAPPYLSAFFASGEFRIAFLSPGSACNNLDYGGSYASIRDLLKTEIAGMLPGTPSPARS